MDSNSEVSQSKSKFHAKRTLYNGTWYASRKESRYAAKLDVLKKSCHIKERVIDYETQIAYNIVVNGLKICAYRLDFKVTYADGRIEHVDVKGMKGGTSYDVFKMKSKLMEAIHGIKIIEA